MQKNSAIDFKKYLVKKPWGCEHIAYQNKVCCVGLLKIDYNKETSLHCHPNKKTGLIVVEGEVQIELGFYNTKIIKAPGKIMIRPGLFHSTKCISKKGSVILEVENPVDKNDLVRFKDKYGREKKPYEGLDKMKEISSSEIIFEEPKDEFGNNFNFKDVKISIEKHTNFKKLLKEDKETIFAVVERGMTDKNLNYVLSVGDIVKTDTIKKLSESFMINKFIKLIKIKKK
jgi:mannose-6-phosphate isomerase-like protein (cupin superfamily)